MYVGLYMPICMFLCVYLCVFVCVQCISLSIVQRLWTSMSSVVCWRESVSGFYTCSRIASFTKEQFHRLPISALIDYKVLLLIPKAQLGVAPKCLRDSIRSLLSATSLRPLRSFDKTFRSVPLCFLHGLERLWSNLYRSFTVIGPSLWSRLPPASRNWPYLPLFNLSTSLALLKNYMFTRS